MNICIFASRERGCVNNHWLEEEEEKGRSSHHLDIERLIGRSAYLILEGQICLPLDKSLLVAFSQKRKFYIKKLQRISLDKRVQNNAIVELKAYFIGYHNTLIVAF